MIDNDMKHHHFTNDIVFIVLNFALIVKMILFLHILNKEPFCRCKCYNFMIQIEDGVLVTGGKMSSSHDC